MQAAAEAGSIGRSKALDDSLSRAHQLAVAQGHAAVTLEHLLFALQDDPDSQAILASSGVNRDGLAADVSAFIGRLSETAAAAAGAPPQPGADLLRILQLAAMAARQSQRRLMDGAIVLAAIIGDGNSAAAGMLKAQGLTFDAIIQVIVQQGATRQGEVVEPATRAPLPPPDSAASRIARVPDAPSAETMLADVRARVKLSEPPTVPIKAPTSKAQPPKPVASEPPDEPTSPAVVVDRAPSSSPPQPTAPTELPVPVSARTPTVPIAAAPVDLPSAPAHASSPASSGDRPPPAVTPALATLRRPAAGPPPPPPPVLPASGPPPLPIAPAPSAASVRPALPTASGAPVSPPPLPGARQTPPPSREAAQRNIAPYSAPAPPPITPASVAPTPVPTPPTAPLPFAPSPAPPPPTAQPPQAPTPPPPMMAPQALSPLISVNVVAAASGLPAVMRIGTPVLVEVRIPRDQIDVPRHRGAQMLGTSGEAPVYRIVSVRLGTGGVSGLAIEPRSPETIWIGMGRDVDATDFVWQFVATPTRAGRFAVTLGIAGRTVSPYGVAGDGTPVSETFAVNVKRPRGGRVKRLLAAALVFALGAATMALAGAPLLAAAKTVLARLVR